MKPSHGIVKVNFDAIVLSKKMGYGMIALDSDGFLLGGGGGIVEMNLHADWAELKIRGGLPCVYCLGRLPRFYCLSGLPCVYCPDELPHVYCLGRLCWMP
ncbi:hypothetical protein Gogos_017597 [Gossypium gossypioides]|uniref:Uncharacterized protein n=1 Tax=Gossypium gossypioides TaxID=34282 RepID=A0A7J9BBC8_GOSGO|nr:hypothetical protein [Gossypium gossypioides]